MNTIVRCRGYNSWDCTNLELELAEKARKFLQQVDSIPAHSPRSLQPNLRAFLISSKRSPGCAISLSRAFNTQQQPYQCLFELSELHHSALVELRECR
jgi:hypothetical protein